MLRSRIAQTLNVLQRVRLGPSLAAALLEDLFDHPLVEFFKGYFQTESGFSLAAGLPPLMCSSKIVATSASVTLEYQVASG